MIFLCFYSTGGILEFTFILTRGKILSYDTSNITAYDASHICIVIRDELAPNWWVSFKWLNHPWRFQHTTNQYMCNSWVCVISDLTMAFTRFIHKKNNTGFTVPYRDTVCHIFFKRIIASGDRLHHQPLPKDQMSCDGRDIFYCLTLNWQTYSIYLIN